MCDLEVTGAPSIFNVIHSAAALARMLPTLDLRSEELGCLKNRKKMLKIRILEIKIPDFTAVREKI